MHRKHLIFFALLIAFFLRIYGITLHDSYTDEAILGFRAIELVDYDGSLLQTTPWQWLPTVPWWAHLSLHDHPIGFFLLQHAFIRAFGENLLAVRLPAVLSGIASVAFLFFIGKKLFDENIGLLAAGLLAVSSYHLWVSRLGLQDGVVIFLLLLALWLLLKTKDDARWWLLVGAAIGLGVIIKYTIAIIVPIVIWYCLVYRIPAHTEKYFWYGVLALVVISAPSWLYNLMLYRAFGHFDFQISGFLGQEVPAWQFRMGRAQVGGLMDRFKNFFLALYFGNSQWFNAASGASMAVVLWTAVKQKNREHQFLFGATMLVYLWFFVIGSTYRFVAMIVPFLILGIASVFFGAAGRHRTPVLLAASGFFLFAELVFSFNTFFVDPPKGKENLSYAKISEETKAVGFNALDAYLDQLFAGRVSALFGSPAYDFLTEIQQRRIGAAKVRGAAPYSVFLIYDHDMNFVANLWIFQRRLLYDGWPILPDDEFLHLTGDKYESFYREQGVEHFVYVATLREEVRRAPRERVGKREVFLPYLEAKGIVPEILTDRSGTPAFAVYHF